jgi:hypothetical protein
MPSFCIACAYLDVTPRWAGSQQRKPPQQEEQAAEQLLLLLELLVPDPKSCCNHNPQVARHVGVLEHAPQGCNSPHLLGEPASAYSADTPLAWHRAPGFRRLT